MEKGLEMYSCGIDTLEVLFFSCNDAIARSLDREGGPNLLRKCGGFLLALTIDGRLAIAWVEYDFSGQGGVFPLAIISELLHVE